MRIAAGVTTAGRQYLAATLASLAAAGFSDPLVSDDRNERLGPYGNLRQVLAQLLERFPDCDALAVFQDDIRIAGGVREWLERTGWPGLRETIGVISIYCAEPHQFQRYGWHKLPLQPDDGFERDEAACRKALAQFQARGELFPESGLATIEEVRVVRNFRDCQVLAARLASGEWKWFWTREGTDGDGHRWSDLSELKQCQLAYGACALIFPRESARLLLEREPRKTNQADIQIAEFCCAKKLDYWLHTPSLVQHVGVESTLHDFGINEFRRAGYFCEDVNKLKGVRP